jgi:hypothetical protein
MNAKHQPHGLEAQRQAILERMQMSREAYRRFLRDEPELEVSVPHGGIHPPSHTISPMQPDQSIHGYQNSHPISRFSGARDTFPRSAAMRWITEHPFMCAAAVAAVVMIGPGRIARLAMKGGTAATALTLRNPSNVDNISRVLSLVADYAQRMNPRA